MPTPLGLTLALGLSLSQASSNQADVPMPPPPPGVVKRDLPMPPPPAGTTPKAPAAEKPAEAKPAVQQSPIKLAALELNGLNMDAKEVSFYSEHVAQQLAFQGVRVTTSKEISTLLGFERQKHLLNCNEGSSSCVAELANALGVDCILTGDIGKFGTKYQITLKALSASDARVLAAHSQRVNGDEALLDELTRAARFMAPELAKKLGRKLHATQQAAALVQDTGPQIPWGWVALGAGAAVAGGGGYSLSLAADRYTQLVGAQQQVRTEDAVRFRSEGSLFQTVGWVGVGLGAAAMAGGVAMLVMPSGAPAKAQAMVLPTADGFVFSVGGVLP
ncbi:MAG: hypothetical protein M3Y59_01365 [Myxococcota bacterium]|nr:hypothetical protein [Myxococcota bacterium]